MADSEYKRLLAKISLDTSDFQANVKKLKATLDDLYQQEKKKVAEQKAALDAHTASVKKNAEQMKVVGDQQMVASKRQLESLQQSKQAYSEITQASVKLKAQTDLEAISVGTIAKKRRDIIAQCEIEMDRIVRLRTPLTEQSRLLTQIGAERQRQLGIIDRQVLAEQRVAAAAAKQLLTAEQLKARQAAAATRLIVPPYEQETARLRSQITTGQLARTREIEAAEKRILSTIDAQIRLITAKVNLDRDDVVALNRLESARARASRLIPGGAGGGGGEGGLEQGFFGKLQRGLVGGLGFREIAGGTFAGVLGAEVLGSMIGGWTRSIVDLVAESGKLEHLQDTFQRLGSIKGIDTTRFLDQMRGATHDLVGDEQMLQLTNAALQSNMKMTSGQVVQLTHDVTALARARGNTPEEAMGALQRAFIGRGGGGGGGGSGAAFAQLGRVTGIQTPELMVQRFGAVIPETMQREEAWNKVLEVTHEKAMALGEPVLTLQDHLTALGNEWKRAKDAFAIELVKTEGFKALLGLLGSIEDKLRNAEDVGKGFADAIGHFLEALSFYGRAVENTLSALKAAFLTPWAEIDKASGKAKESSHIILDLAQSYNSLQYVVQGLATALAFAVRELDTFAEAATFSKGPIESLHDSIQEYKDYVEQINNINVNFRQLHQDIENAKHPAGPVYGPPQAAAPASATPEPTDPAYAIKMHKLQKDLDLALDKEQLENTKAMLQAEKDANEEAYASMKETFAQYISAKKRLRAEDLNATLLEAKQDREAKLADEQFQEDIATADLKKQHTGLLAQQAALPANATAEQIGEISQALLENQHEISVTTKAYELHKKAIDATYGGTVARDIAAEARDQQQLNDQLIKDSEAAARTRAQTTLEIRKQGLEEEKQTLEDSFKDGLTSADAYLAKRKDQIQEELNATLAELDDRFNHTQLTLNALAELEKDTDAARAKAAKESLALELGADETKLKAQEQAYDRTAKLLATQEKIAGTPRGAALIGDSQIDIINKEIELTNVQIQQRMALINSIKEEKKEGDARYQAALDDVAALQEKQQQYNEQLAKARDLLTPTGGLLDKLAGLVGTFQQFGPQQIAEGLRSGATTFQAMGQFKQTMATQTGRQGNPFLSLFKEGKDTTQSLAQASGDATVQVHGFAGALQTAIDVVHGFMRVMSGGESVPSYDVGGTVPEDQLAYVHKGEKIISAEDVKRIPSYATGTQPPGFWSLSAPREPSLSSANQLNNVLKTLTVQFQTLGNSLGVVATKFASLGTGTPLGATAPMTQGDLLGVALGNLNSTSAVNTTGLSEQGSPTKPSGGLASTLFGDSAISSELASSNLKEFVGGLGNAASAVGGFVKSTLGATSGLSGAIGGATSGAALAGPAGAIGGAILGLISGIINSNDLKNLNSLMDQFAQTLSKLNAGVIGLNVAIQQTGTTMAQLASSPAGLLGSLNQTKAQALQSTGQQLQQLQQQQQTILKSLQDSLNNLIIPTGYQQFVGNIEQIFTQYKQFAEAAQNVTQLGQAQEYLTNALQQYAITQATTVQSSEITAIQNGINLNNLYLQRQQLMEQFGQQEQQIMSGGVAVREESASASKAAQLQQLQIGFAQQMDQMNMQISVAQYQYETQQQIYGLATTRVGLETQLLTLQMSQTDQQNASNAALLNIVNTIRSTPASQLTTTPQLMAALGLPYQGPTSQQVGPQIGQLGALGPGGNAAFLKAVLGSPQALSIGELYGVQPGATSITDLQVQDILSNIVQSATVHSQSSSTGAQLTNLYQLLQSALSGAPGSQFSPYYPVPPMYPAEGLGTQAGESGLPVPWEYGGTPGQNNNVPVQPIPVGTPGGPTTTPGNGPCMIYPAGVNAPGIQVPCPPGVGTNAPVPPVTPPTLGTTPQAASSTGVLPAAPVIQTQSTAGATSPIYYLADPSSGNLVPVYNTPTYFTGTGAGAAAAGAPALTSGAPAGSFSVQGMGTSGYYTTPGFTTPSNVIPGVGGTTGLGSQSGATTTLQDLLQYPTLGEQASTTLPGGSPGGVPIISGGYNASPPTPLQSNLVLYGTDANGSPVYIDQTTGDLYDAAGELIGNVSASAPTTIATGPGTPAGLAGSSLGLATGNYQLPAGAGPSSGPTGPVILSGSSNPFAYGPSVGSTPAPPAGVTPAGNLLGSYGPLGVPRIGEGIGVNMSDFTTLGSTPAPPAGVTPAGNLLGSGGMWGAPSPARPGPIISGPYSTALPNYQSGPIPSGGGSTQTVPSNWIQMPWSINTPVTYWNPTTQQVVYPDGSPVLSTPSQGPTSVAPLSGPGTLGWDTYLQAQGLGSLPQYQSGIDTVPTTGPAILHAGETVTSAATNQATTALNSAKVGAEQSMSSIASTRIGMEMKLLQMKAQQNSNDLQVLNAYQAVMAAISSGNFNGIGSAISTLGGNRTGPGAPHIEDSLYTLYSERGRYGEGGVAGNYP